MSDYVLDVYMQSSTTGEIQLLERCETNNKKSFWKAVKNYIRVKDLVVIKRYAGKDVN